MNVNEFLKLIDLETINGQWIGIIIPIEEKIIDLNHVILGDKHLSNNEKVVFTCDGTSAYEDGHYVPFGIEPCFKDDNKEEDIDIRISDDNYHFVYDDDGQIWIVIDNFN